MSKYQYGPNAGDYPFHDAVVAFIKASPLSDGQEVAFMEDWVLVRGVPKGGELVVHELDVDGVHYFLECNLDGLFDDMGEDDTSA